MQAEQQEIRQKDRQKDALFADYIKKLAAKQKEQSSMIAEIQKRLNHA